jgi:hypothetical protein
MENISYFLLKSRGLKSHDIPIISSLFLRNLPNPTIYINDGSKDLYLENIHFFKNAVIFSLSMAFWMDRKAIFRILCGSIESMLGPSKGGYMSPSSSPHYACARIPKSNPKAGADVTAQIKYRGNSSYTERNTLPLPNITDGKTMLASPGNL